MVKVRFAPSPTGHLHIGNAKTALYNYLFARKAGGTFVLRMEDTDRERSEAIYERSIMDDLAWLGITWDEGPVRQSERLELYTEHAKLLMEKGRAYKCFCTEEELAAARQRSLTKGEPPRYSGKCRDLPAEEAERLAREGRAFTVRFRADARPITFHDGIRGELSFPRGHVEDLIILRNDGTPTYNLAVVVDDMLMGVTDVIRGSDHIPNTPKQIALFHAFGAEAPRYAHHSLLIGPDHKPLSKRHGATRVIDFRSLGIVRDALVNYLCTMGRNTSAEIMDFDELVRTFSLDSISASDNIFDREKLLWFNREYLKHMPLEKLIAEAGLDAGQADRISAVRENASTIVDLKGYLDIFTTPGIDERALTYLAKTDRAVEIAHEMKGLLSGNEKISFDDLANRIGMRENVRKKDLFMILRAFVTGRPDGPPLKDVFPLVPTGIINSRIEAYLDHHER